VAILVEGDLGQTGVAAGDVVRHAVVEQAPVGQGDHVQGAAEGARENGRAGRVHGQVKVVVGPGKDVADERAGRGDLVELAGPLAADEQVAVGGEDDTVRPVHAGDVGVVGERQLLRRAVVVQVHAPDVLTAGELRVVQRPGKQIRPA